MFRRGKSISERLLEWKVAPMVSAMESYSEAREALAELERGEASPYVDYPPTPAWYPPSVGVFAGALVVGIAVLINSTWLGCVVIGGLVVLEAAFLSWYSRFHGAMPSMRNPPMEFRSLIRRFAVGYAALIGVTVALWFLTNAWVTAAAVAGMATVAVTIYEKAYAATAARTSARLA